MKCDTSWEKCNRRRRRKSAMAIGHKSNSYNEQWATKSNKKQQQLRNTERRRNFFYSLWIRKVKFSFSFSLSFSPIWLKKFGFNHFLFYKNFSVCWTLMFSLTRIFLYVLIVCGCAQIIGTERNFENISAFNFTIAADDAVAASVSCSHVLLLMLLLLWLLSTNKYAYILIIFHKNYGQIMWSPSGYLLYISIFFLCLFSFLFPVPFIFFMLLFSFVLLCCYFDAARK